MARINLQQLDRRLGKLEAKGEGPESHVIIVSFCDAEAFNQIESGGMRYQRIDSEDDFAFRARVISERQSTQGSPIILIPRVQNHCFGSLIEGSQINSNVTPQLRGSIGDKSLLLLQS